MPRIPTFKICHLLPQAARRDEYSPLARIPLPISFSEAGTPWFVPDPETGFQREKEVAFPRRKIVSFVFLP